MLFKPGLEFSHRLGLWREAREQVANHSDPIQAAIDLYTYAPWVSIHTDPYDRDSWPTPWELLQENCYCDFCRLLGIAYTLQLTECFNSEQFMIHIQRSKETGELFYLLFVGNRVIGYDGDTHVADSDIPDTHELLHQYTLSS